MRIRAPLGFAVIFCVACAPEPAPSPPPRSTPVFDSGAAPTPGDASAADTRPNDAPTLRTAAEKDRDDAIASRLAPIFDAYVNQDATLSPDGTKVLFLSNRDGSPEAFVADRAQPSAPPRKIVAGPERVASVAWSRDGAFALFRRDQGGDENFRIFRARPDGTDLIEIGPDEAMHKDDVLLPRNAPNTIVYSARKTSRSETKVFVAPLDGRPAHLAFTDEGPSFGLAVSPDAKRMLLLRFTSPTNQVLFEVDLNAARATRIYPRDGKSAGIGTAQYSADGSSILFATDEGGESSVLIAIDPARKIELARYAAPKGATLESLAVSPRGDRIAIARDLGNHTELALLDAKTLKLERELNAPLGAYTLGNFSDDGTRFTVTQSIPDVPKDIVAFVARSGALERLREEPRATSSLGALDVTLTTIRAHDGLPIPLHFYLPKNRDVQKKLPVVAYFHGGPTMSASVRWNWVARAFTAEGYAFVEPNIRGSTGFGRAFEMADNREKREDALRDVESVNAWLREQPWADPNRLMIFGSSYGGYLVLMSLGRTPDAWRAGGDLFGIADLVALLSTGDQDMVEEFGDAQKDRELLERFSPTRVRDRIRAPLFVYQGANDARVPRAQSDELVARLRSRGVRVEYVVANDEGHSLDHKNNRIEVLARALRFLEEE